MTELLNEAPFFIVGSGRSGTTLVRSLLNAHPRLAVPPETHFMRRAARRRGADPEAPPDFEAFWRELVRWRRFRDLGVDPDEVRRLVDRAGRQDFKTVFAALLRAYADRTGKPRAGEKTPGHHRYLDRLFAWFPDARIIVVQRDPRAVVASHLRSPWVADHLAARRPTAPIVPRSRLFHVAERATRWMQAYDHHLAAFADDPRFLVVAYERLVAEPVAELRRICEFLGESYEPAMLGERAAGGDTTPATAPAGWYAWEVEHHARAAGAISNDSRERWREDLSAREIAWIEALCTPRMTILGYRPESDRGRAGARLAGTLLLAADAEGHARRWLRRRRR